MSLQRWLCMKRKIVITCLLLSLVPAWSAVAIPKANFSGKWVMDKEKSEGIPKGMEQVMTIVQNGDQLDVTTKVYPDVDMIASLVNDIFDLSGKETEFVAQRAGIPGKGRRTAKWAEDGRGFDVAEETAVDMPQQGTVKTQITRKWTLSADGKTITIELVSKDPQREVKTKRVFVKA